MNRVTRRGFAVAAAFVAASLMAACSPPPPAGGGAQTPGTSGAATAPAGGTTKSLTIWLQQKPDFMSPFKGQTYGNSSILLLTQDSLAYLDEKGELQPRVATKWNMSSDGKTLTMTIADQKFSDGTPMTADDVVWSINAYGNPATKSPTAAVLKSVEGFAEFQSGAAKSLSGVKKVDDRTVSVTLSAADSGFQYLFLGSNFWILPSKALADQDLTKIAESEIWTTPGKVAGLGPMTMTANVTGQRVEFAKNPNYRTPIKFDKLTEVLVTQDVATSQLRSGEIDLTLVAPTDVATVKGMTGIKTITADTPGYDRYAINNTLPKFANPKVKQGLLTAIDRAGIIKSVYSDQAVPWNSSFTAQKIKFDALNKYSYDPAKAKQLLTEGGWDFNTEVVIWQANGNAFRASVNQVVLKNWQDIGVKARINPQDQAQQTQVIPDKSYDVFLFGGGNYLSDPSINSPMMTCAGAFPKGAAVGYYCNPKVDELFTQAAATTDETKRADLLNQAAVISNNDVDQLWIARPTRVYAHSSKITGGLVGGDGIPNVLYSIHNWTVS